MANYVTNNITITWSLDDILSFYKKYEDDDVKFSFCKVITPEKLQKRIEELNKQNPRHDNYYDYLFWISPFETERKEIKSSNDLPWYISFDTRWLCPLYLTEAIISQNPNLWFHIQRCSESGTNGEITWKYWEIVSTIFWEIGAGL